MSRYLSYIFLAAIGFIMISFAQFIFIIIPPKINLVQTPENFGLPKEDISFITKDKIRLSGWFVERVSVRRGGAGAAAPPRALILLHSYPFNKADLLPLARDLYNDFSILLFDMRYFGTSDGKYTTFGIKERYDVSAAAEFLEYRGYEKIGIFGYSLGGAVAIIAASEEQKIDAVASYGAFSNIIMVGKESFQGLSILTDPFIELFGVFARPLFGAWPQTLSPEHAASKIKVPVFIVHAKTDKEIPFSHALRLKDALINNPDARFYFLETGLHGELPVDIGSRLKIFFNETLR